MRNREDHEKVVAAARNDMHWFDQRQALERWIQNYVSPSTIIPPGQWCVVTKDAKGWKVEHGLADKDTPYLTHYADKHAPQPPVMEIRPPKPEPVKPRFQVPEPPKVQGNDYLAALSAKIDRDLMLAICNSLAPPKPESLGLTATMIRQMQQEADRLLRPYTLKMERAAVDHRADAFRYMMTWGMQASRPASIITMDLGEGDTTAVQEFRRPPPASSVRNK